MIFGVDTASVARNKRIDWAAAASAGIAFAFLRTNYGDQQDTMFAREWPRITAAGLVRGGYLYLRHPRLDLGVKTAPTPESQARAMLDTLGAYLPGDLPPAIDVEFSGRGRVDTGLTAGQLLGRVRAAVALVRTELGVWPLLYTSARVWRDDLDNLNAPELAECALWLARYYVPKGPACLGGPMFGQMPWPPVPPPWGDQDNAWVHQYQGDATGCPGFPTGNVDMNRFKLLGPDGARVRWVQERLGIGVDGELDDYTAQAIKDFQAARGLLPDGVVGPRTFAYLAWQKPA